jgi:HD domain
MTSDRVADLAEPTSPVALAARALSERVSPPFLFNHAARTDALAVLFARLDGIELDRELVYVGALLHDLGLTEGFDGPRCFENESAAAAADFARDHGWDELRQERLASAIRFHMHPRVVPEDDAAGYLLSEATSCDVRGHRVDDLPPDAVADLFVRYPRLDFTKGFIELFERQARAKPGCLADLYLQRGFADRVRSAPFSV